MSKVDTLMPKIQLTHGASAILLRLITETLTFTSMAGLADGMW